jgi:hypothetical protein
VIARRLEEIEEILTGDELEHQKEETGRVEDTIEGDDVATDVRV